VIVIANYEGRAAEEVEQQVTVPLERATEQCTECDFQKESYYFWIECRTAEL